MKKILLSAVLLASTCSFADARDTKGCFLFARRNKTTTTTQWYRAKDGTVRKMLPYWDAMHRAEDADRLETELQKAQTDLAAAQAANAQTTADLAAAKTQAEALQKELEAARAQLAQLKTASETQSAELKKQIDSEKTTAASQKERADKAENAHKTAVGQVASLREEALRQAETLTGVRTELKATAEERDALKVRSEELQKAVTAAETAAKQTREELEALKKTVEENKKADETKPADPPQEGTTDEQPKVEGEKPAEPAAGN
ncbi:MAG: hypothetical protein ACK5BP_22245 [Planctomyces sp.]